MADKISFEAPRGMRDFYPEDMAWRNRVFGAFRAAADHGLIDYVRILRTLRDVGYAGVCGLELANAYGKPTDINPGADPSWIPRSIGYFRGVMDAM